MGQGKERERERGRVAVMKADKAMLEGLDSRADEESVNGRAAWAGLGVSGADIRGVVVDGERC